MTTFEPMTRINRCSHLNRFYEFMSHQNLTVLSARWYKLLLGVENTIAYSINALYTVHDTCEAINWLLLCFQPYNYVICSLIFNNPRSLALCLESGIKGSHIIQFLSTENRIVIALKWTFVRSLVSSLHTSPSTDIYWLIKSKLLFLGLIFRAVVNVSRSRRRNGGDFLQALLETNKNQSN